MGVRRCEGLPTPAITTQAAKRAAAIIAVFIWFGSVHGRASSVGADVYKRCVGEDGSAAVNTALRYFVAGALKYSGQGSLPHANSNVEVTSEAYTLVAGWRRKTG